MKEVLPTNPWDFNSHAEWQAALDENGTSASLEHYVPKNTVVIDEAKLSADALRFNAMVIGRRDLDQSA